MAGVNGVDVSRLHETVAAVRDDPSLGRVSFSLSSEWLGKFRARSQTGPVTQAGKADAARDVSFALASDEPPALLGDDTAASAGEYVLQALAACYAVTFAANAAVAGISLDSLQLELEGDFDLRGFLAIDESVRPGMQELRVNVRATTGNASREQLEDLVRTVEKRSPIRDTLASPVPVRTRLL